MNTLPKELEDIIYEYAHHLKMNDIMGELWDGFSICDFCFINKHEMYLFFCKNCSVEYCSNCKDKFIRKHKGLCNSCYYEEAIFSQIEIMINREYVENELMTIIRLVEYLDELERLEIFQYLNSLHQQGISKTFTRILAELTCYIVQYL